MPICTAHYLTAHTRQLNYYVLTSVLTEFSFRQGVGTRDLEMDICGERQSSISWCSIYSAVIFRCRCTTRCSLSFMRGHNNAGNWRVHKLSFLWKVKGKHGQIDWPAQSWFWDRFVQYVNSNLAPQWEFKDILVKTEARLCPNWKQWIPASANGSVVSTAKLVSLLLGSLSL